MDLASCPSWQPKWSRDWTELPPPPQHSTVWKHTHQSSSSSSASPGFRWWGRGRRACQSSWFSGRPSPRSGGCPAVVPLPPDAPSTQGHLVHAPPPAQSEQHAGKGELQVDPLNLWIPDSDTGQNPDPWTHSSTLPSLRHSLMPDIWLQWAEMQEKLRDCCQDLEKTADFVQQAGFRFRQHDQRFKHGERQWSNRKILILAGDMYGLMISLWSKQLHFLVFFCLLLHLFVSDYFCDMCHEMNLN